ncbi:unnamed protein product [Blepharisma stoltei]|uniref:Cyclin n=1 Tax=Blepharisma stoltei TaxID=1481888 RepID=A0AAU9IMR7_9CILI|nr:unnamed protein product [Blepharisma stoltei]
MTSHHHNSEIPHSQCQTDPIDAYPSLKDLTVGFSACLQAKIIEDLETKENTSTPKSDVFFNKFHLMEYLRANSKDAPSIDEIFSFTYQLYSLKRLSGECLILTLMYMLRVSKSSGIKIFNANWRQFVFTATITAQKVCNSIHLCNLEFEDCFTDLSSEEIFDMDGEFFNLMKHKYEVDLAFFQNIFEILAYALEDKSKKKWKLNEQKINKIIKRSKTFDEDEEEENDLSKFVSERMYNIDLDKLDWET